MVLLIFVAAGIFAGYRLQLTRNGYAVMALIAGVTLITQIALLFVSHSRGTATLLPLMFGFMLILSMLTGAVLRLARRKPPRAIQ